MVAVAPSVAAVERHGVDCEASPSVLDCRLLDFAAISADWFWETDAHLRFTWLSSSDALRDQIADSRWLGRPWEELLGIPSSGATAPPCPLQEMAARRPFRDFRWYLRAASGEDVCLSISGMPIFDEQQRFVGYRGVGKNISAQVQDDRRAHEAHQQIADAIEGFSGGFALFDAADRLLLANARFRGMLCGDSADLLPGSDFTTIFRRLLRTGQIRPEDRDQEGWLDRWRGERKMGTTVRTFEIGDGHWIEVQDFRSHGDRRMLFCSDVTAQRLAAEALRKSEASLANAQRIAGIGHWDLCVRSNKMEWSDEMFRIFGYEPRSISPEFDDFIDVVHPADRAYVDAAIRFTLYAGAPYHIEHRICRRDGSERIVSQEGEVRFDGGGIAVAMTATVCDITERRLAERELRESEERFRAMAECSLLGLAIERDDRALFVNQTFATIFGFDDPAAVRNLSSLSELFVGDDWAQLCRSFNTNPPGVPPSAEAQPLLRHEHRGQHRDGRTIWLHTQMWTIPWNGGGSARQLIVIDISLRKTYEQQLAHQANYDALTGLPNRTLALDRLRTAIAGARRYDRKVALLFIDVDHFKKINDVLGHAAGDDFLREMAKRLSRCVREADTVARLGGDEFLMVLPEVHDSGDAEHVARRIIEAVNQPFLLDGQEVFISISVGICIFPDDGDHADKLLCHADAAMYVAKEEGRGTTRFFTSELNDRLRDRMQIEAAMRRALERDEFTLAFQPVIDLATGKVVAAEALLRWENDTLGTVSPDRFIPVAEESGMIVPLGAWVLHNACEQLARWRAAGFARIRLCVNVSSRQFRGTSLVEAVTKALSQHNLAADSLELEITESLLMDDVVEVESTLRQLESCGVRLAVDDFGTGYSSLSYLSRFPLDTLKIDRSFIASVGTDNMQASLVEAIIVMAHRLSLDVIAEGVETPEQTRFLRDQGCDFVQGYYFSRPLTADAFLRYVEDWRAESIHTAAG